MDYLLLITAIIVLLFSLRKISMIKYSKEHSVLKEAKLNALSMVWGVFVISAIIFIPYQVWGLTGGSHDWDGAYTVGLTALLTVAVSFVFYHKISLKSN
ncbi:hypothetical protein LCL95_01555 [Bacillus timonensis]|nr:hypothetical protein [Bacillus timonensis]